MLTWVCRSWSHETLVDKWLLWLSVSDSGRTQVLWVCRKEVPVELRVGGSRCDRGRDSAFCRFGEGLRQKIFCRFWGMPPQMPPVSPPVSPRLISLWLVCREIWLTLDSVVVQLKACVSRWMAVIISLCGFWMYFISSSLQQFLSRLFFSLESGIVCRHFPVSLTASLTFVSRNV